MPKDSMPEEEIKSLRSALGMVQEEFAKELEVTQGVVSDWERGEYDPTAENYVNLAKLAARNALHLVAIRFLEHAGVGDDLLAAVSHLAKESRSRRDAAYQQGLAEAQSLRPNDALFQYRYATRFAERALQKRKR